MVVYGFVHEVIENERIISIIENDHVAYYYATKSLFSAFQKYLDEDIIIYFNTLDVKKIIHGKSAKKIESIIKIMYPKKHGSEIFYDVTMIKAGIKDLINEEGNHLFLDLEMTMPEYGEFGTYVSEVIEAGYVLCNKNDVVIEKNLLYIKPTREKELSSRAVKFLHINKEDVMSGISFKEFYDKLKSIIDEYHPMVVVWGRNDILSLKEAYIINDLPNLNTQIRFVDLLKVHKNYFSLKNDLGLFNTYAKYTGEKEDQSHDALVDATYTKEVFKYFKKLCNGKIDIKFEE